MKYNFIEKESLNHMQLSFWQSPTWHDILVNSHHAREVFYFGNVGGTFLLIEIRSIGLGMYGAFSLGTTSSQIAGDVVEFFVSLRQMLRKKKVIFLQIEPLEGAFPDVPKSRARVYREFLYPYTRVIDLTVSEEAVQAQMHEKGRYHVRLAQKRGVTVKCVPHTEENIDIWMSLLDETTARDGFAANSREYYASFLRILGDEGKLYFASTSDDRVVAAGIWVFRADRAIYYYGASSSDAEDRKLMAPYLLQWQAILDAKKAGIPLYDFLGVAEPNNPHDHLAGVTRFKERFGGVLVKLPEKYIVSFSKKVRWFFYIRKLKKLIFR